MFEILVDNIVAIRLAKLLAMERANKFQFIAASKHYNC